MLLVYAEFKLAKKPVNKHKPQEIVIGLWSSLSFLWLFPDFFFFLSRTLICA